MISEDGRETFMYCFFMHKNLTENEACGWIVLSVSVLTSLEIAPVASSLPSVGAGVVGQRKMQNLLTYISYAFSAWDWDWDHKQPQD